MNKFILSQFWVSVPLLAGLDSGPLEQLTQAGQIRLMPKGSVIFLQGDTAHDLYIIRSGSVALSYTNPDGRELVVREIRAGDYFGELGLIADRPRSMSATTREKCELVLIPRAVFLSILNQEPALARNLLLATAQKLYAVTEREQALAFMDAPARLARLLLQYERQSGDPGYITISQDDLARRTGLTRQTVAKTLGRWRRLGWLLTGRGKIVLLNHKALQTVERP